MGDKTRAWGNEAKSHGIPSSNLDFAIVFGAEGQVQESLTNELFGVIGNWNRRFGPRIITRPVVLNEETQSAEGQLTSGNVN